MNEEELKELQRLYDGGVQLDVVKDRLVAGGQEQVIPEVEEFYQKKKTLESKIQSQNWKIQSLFRTYQSLSRLNSYLKSSTNSLKRVLYLDPEMV